MEKINEKEGGQTDHCLRKQETTIDRQRVDFKEGEGRREASRDSRAFAESFRIREFDDPDLVSWDDAAHVERGDED